MNKQFTDEQIRAYTSQFKEGDAIWCSGKWRKVSKSTMSQSLRCESPNPYVISCYDGEVAISGFKEEEDVAYRVTTLEHYYLQGDEKIVWLGESNDSTTFGKAYNVQAITGGYIYCNDKGNEIIISSSYWGVIPKFKVTTEKDMVKDSKHKKSVKPINENLESYFQKQLSLIPHADSLVEYSHKIFSNVESLLDALGENLLKASSQGMSSYTTYLSTSLSSQQVELTEAIIKKLLTEKGYTVETTTDTKQIEIHHELEDLSTIKLELSW